MLRLTTSRSSTARRGRSAASTSRSATDEIVSVVGPNGAGKTTLVNALAGLLRDRAGEIVIDGVDLMRAGGHEVCEHGVAIVPEGRRIFAGMSVAGQPRRSARTGAARATHGEARLARVHELFPILADRADAARRDAERRRAADARARPRPHVASRGSCSSTSRRSASPRSSSTTLFDAIGEIHASGVAILLVEQNVTRALAISERGYLLSDGTHRPLRARRRSCSRTPRSSASASASEGPTTSPTLRGGTGPADPNRCPRSLRSRKLLTTLVLIWLSRSLRQLGCSYAMSSRSGGPCR